MSLFTHICKNSQGSREYPKALLYFPLFSHPHLFVIKGKRQKKTGKLSQVSSSAKKYFSFLEASVPGEHGEPWGLVESDCGAIFWKWYTLMLYHSRLLVQIIN